MAYCIISFHNDENKTLINIYKNNVNIGYRYIDYKKSFDILGNSFKRNSKKNFQKAHMSVICALTPDLIPICPSFSKFNFKNLRQSIKNTFKYLFEYHKYLKYIKVFRNRPRVNKIEKLGTIFLKRIIEILKDKNIDIITLNSLHLLNNDSRINFYKRHGFNYCLNNLNMKIYHHPYYFMLHDLNKNAILKKKYYTTYV